MSVRASAIGLATVIVLMGAGAAYSVTGENTVDSAAIIDGAVTSADVADNGLTGVDIDPGRRIVTRSVTISVDKQLGFSVNCPAGTTVSGGGFRTASSDVYVIASYPASATSWKVTAENWDYVSRSVLAYAICDAL
jgi:hypothetical protein